jgi:uncharacterized membrane protein YhaH (DUF805 family)
MVHLPSPAFVYLHPAASSKTQRSPYLTGILSASRWNITLYIGGKMSSQSCNDDTGHPLRVALISLVFVIAITDLTAICPVRRLTQFQIPEL